MAARFRRLSTAAARQSVTSAWVAWTSSTMEELARRRLLRDLRAVVPIGGSSSRVSSPHGELLVFAANDYLGLSAHTGVRAAASAAAAEHGSGPRSSALVCGYTDAHRGLELGLARLKACEEALLFPTGFAANMAVVGTLADGPDCAIFSDALNHASIVDGARLAARGAGASLHIYRHNDLDHLETLLAASSAPRKLVISDSLFSMDGDLADCRGLATLRDRYGALLCLDEAHATLVYGAHGGGVAEAQGVADRVDVHVGTLSKAFGSHGGFVGCSAPLKSLLLSRGRAGIYSTALPLPAVAAAHAALELATPQLRGKLWANVAAFAEACPHGATIDDQAPAGQSHPSPIIPIVIGSEEAALDAAERLLEQGFLVPAIRPPTVPAAGTCASRSPPPCPPHTPSKKWVRLRKFCEVMRIFCGCLSL